MSAGDGGIVIRRGSVVTPAGIIEGCDVRIEQGRIVAVGADLPTAGTTVIEAGDRLVAPGWIDLHVHGAVGAAFEDGEPEATERITAALSRYGTTAVLATVSTLPADRLLAAVEAIGMACRRGAVGARVLGIHLEGPYLNPARAGAQRPDWMRDPSVEEVDRLQRACGGLIRLVTVAPELPTGIEFIAAMRSRGITVSLGHTAADPETVARAVSAGASHVTHLFNAMGAWHQREPGFIGSALSEDRLSVELICDGVHVHPQAVGMALRCKPAGTVALVSDAVAACAARGAEIEMLGTVCVIGDAVRVKATGQLAGSCLTLDAALRRLRGWCPARPLTELLGMASAVPAAVLGLSGELGTLVRGRVADVVVANADLEVVAALSGGRIAYRAA
jgi:N-acetylglucosamine-6-phosphate deacetylase